MIFAKAGSWFRKRLGRDEPVTDSRTQILAGYYTKAMNLFHALDVDVESKPAETQRLYHMILLYHDHDEAICPAAARTANLIGFLDSLGTGRTLPPADVEVSKEVSEDVDGYLADEIARNHLGMKAIHDEIEDALAKFVAKHAS
jgi:hypothetical protein